jgi:hypothetical protein
LLVDLAVAVKRMVELVVLEMFLQSRHYKDILEELV